MMLKDLKLAIESAEACGANIPFGSHAAEMYQAFCDNGGDVKDFSGIIETL